MIRYLIYSRVSTQGQADNTSLYAQEQMSRAFADERGWTHVETLRDSGTSGALLQRDGIERTFELLDTGAVDVVLFPKVDRAARESKAFSHFWEGIYMRGGRVGIVEDAKVHATLTDLQHDTVFKRAIAEHEWLTIKKRTDDGKRRHLERGSYMNRPSYGYTLKREKRDGISINVPEPDVEEAKVIAWVIEKYLDGQTYYDISRALNAQGVPTRLKGGRWSTTAVHRIMNHARRYAGYPFDISHKVGNKTYDVTYTYPPVITKETYRALRAKRDAGLRASDPHPFKGFIYCDRHRERPSTTLKNSSTRFKGFYPKFNNSCRTVRRKYNYMADERPVEFEVCSYSLSMSFIAKAVKAFVQGDVTSSRLGENIIRLQDKMHSLHLYADTCDAELQEILSRRRTAVARVLDLDGDAFSAVRDALQDELARLGERVEELSREVTTARRQADRIEEVLAELGLDLQGASSIDEQYASVSESMRDLLTAIDEEDPEGIDLGMRSLGLTVYVPFYQSDRYKRRDGVRVEMDFAALLAETEASDEDVFEGYELE